MNLKAWNESLFETLFQSAPDALIIVHADGKIVGINTQTETLFGYSKDELVGQPIEVLLPQRYRGKHVSQRDSYCASPRIRPMGAGLDLFGLKKNGDEVPIEISLSPLHAEGELLVISAIRDVSAQKRIERDLKEARAAADAANRSKTDFLANMSHEIRTPLAGILGYVEMLANYCKTDEERHDYAAKIKRNADNLTDLINDILDLSKVEAGAMKVEHITVFPLQEMEGVVSLLESQARQKGLQLETKVERPVPFQIVSDPKRLRQVLTNLLSNAIKFTDKGSVSITVKCPAPGQLAFEFSDTGCGIPREAQAGLFKPFVQADSSTTRKYGGTGLGLALSRRLANALGGDLQLTHSEIGKGSRFTFTLRAEEAKGPVLPPPTPVATPGTDKVLRGTSILVCEDSADNGEFLVRILSERGAQVELARNGAEGVALAHSEAFDVVLMDIQMPIMDGYAATAQLRKEGKKLPIIALTAHAMNEEKERCLAGGFSDFLIKPVDTEVLVKTILRWKTGKPS